MEKINAFKTKDGKVYRTLKKAIEHELKKKVVGKITEFNVYKNGRLKYKDSNGWHLFAPDGRELTKDAVGKVVNYHFYENCYGVYQYKDDNGCHLFTPDGTELTKDAKGKVIWCHYYGAGKWEYGDDNGVHKGIWKPKK